MTNDAMDMFAARIPKSLKLYLECASTVTGSTMSEIVRTALEEYLPYVLTEDAVEVRIAAIREKAEEASQAAEADIELLRDLTVPKGA